MSSAPSFPLSRLFREAVARPPSRSGDPAADVADAFVASLGLSPESAYGAAVPSGLASDRRVKLGRSLCALSAAACDNAALETRLETVVARAKAVASGETRVPRVRFGKTEVDVSVLTCGGMRLQQTWGQNVTSMAQVDPVCQKNLVDIIRHARKLGINHFETARGYGCSELQFGAAFRELFASGEVRREDVVIQTKLNPTNTAAEFRAQLEDCFERLGLTYIDFFSLHGLNQEHQYDLVFRNGKNGNLIDVVREYMAAGKIRHLGFSTHGQPDVIRKFIESDAFEYVNLHYHYFGSYTASGGGPEGGNLSNLRLCQEKDMGVFIISPFDKGGRLYAPSRRLRELTLPDLEPVDFGAHWLWHHARLHPDAVPVHTIVCGAARASDLDEPAAAAHRVGEAETLRKVRDVARRLEAEMERAVGKEWAQRWHVGLPSCYDSETCSFYTHTVWLSNVIRAYGMLDFAKERYAALEGNYKRWDKSLPNEENVRKLGNGYGYCPGLPYLPGENDSVEKDLVELSPQFQEKVKEACVFVHSLCGKGGSATGEKHWETDYDMRPWTAFPERK